MWDGSVSGSVSGGYIEEWAIKQNAHGNGKRDGHYANKFENSDMINCEWEQQLKESLEGELRQIQNTFSKEDTFLAAEFKNRFNDFVETETSYKNNQCNSSSQWSSPGEIPLRQGPYAVLLASLLIVMWLVQFFSFQFQISTLYCIFFAGLFSISVAITGHITGRLFRGANNRNEKLVLGMILLSTTLTFIISLYGYMWWKSRVAEEILPTVAAGAMNLFLFVGIIYASYRSGDPNPLCTELKKRLDELKNDLDRIYLARKQNMIDKNSSIKKFIDKAQELIPIYWGAYEREFGREVNRQDFPDVSSEFICVINDPHFSEWKYGS